MKEAIINLNDYEQYGSGALGESYISKNDPNILLKLYSREREQMGYDEYERTDLERYVNNLPDADTAFTATCTTATSSSPKTDSSISSTSVTSAQAHPSSTLLSFTGKRAVCRKLSSRRTITSTQPQQKPSGMPLCRNILAPAPASKKWKRCWNLTICCVPSPSNNPWANTVPPSTPPCAR